ncbi:MAG: ABC transporter ATP-binding protein [Chloroflexi bacterium]|nr:ABC transporter ATP-binding protein [Chloroflexota bacterium]MDA8188889.1 ABC transporter ATP-binding protein [Dehalococcoidales bacterium]
MLEVDGIHTYYGLSHILFGVSLRVEKGQIVCLLGRNGAGKTTTMKSIIGLVRPKQGTIRFKGDEVVGKAPYTLARKGIGYVPDERKIFADLTVGENLEIAERKARNGVGWDRARVYEVFPVLKTIESRRGGYLSGGEQRMLAIGRALMGNPEFLILDEPMEGLAPLMVRLIEEQILRLRETGLTVLMTEQNVASALRLSDHSYVIDDGHIRFQGTVEELKANDEVRRKYLLV